MANRFQALQSSTASGSVASEAEAATSASDGGGSNHDADMEFARKLQEEEDRIHYERMLQMAGIGDAPRCNLADATQFTTVSYKHRLSVAYVHNSHQSSQQTTVHCKQEGPS